MTESNHKPSLALDFLIVALAVVLVFLSTRLGSQVGHPPTRGFGAIVGGIYMVYLGLLFLLSYFWPGICRVFSFLTYVSKEYSRPRSRHMALFYFGLGSGIGTWLVLIGLGIFKS